jgi:hypothetical protein
MRRILAFLAICASASQAFAECPATETINAFGYTFAKGGVAGMLNNSTRDCDASDQPAWLAKINEAPPSKGAPAGLAYCRQIALNKDPQNEAQRRDCIYWYGHSIEVR